MTLWHDLRFAARLLRRSPGFTLTAAVVLAIGIGANSAIFTLVDAVLLRPLPFQQPDRLVMLWEHPPGYDHNTVAPLNFLDWSEQNHAFSSMAGISGAARTLAGKDGTAERISGQAVTLAFFDVLGVQPIAGRTFVASDRAAPDIVVLSERFWRSRFGGDPGMIGRTIPLDGKPQLVIGIMPAQFQILYKSDIWVPYLVKRSPEQRRMHYLRVVGRLKPGMSLQKASADMALVAGNIARIAPDTNKGWGVTVEPLRQAIIGKDVRTTSLLLGFAAGFVLLMACANIANLLLARGAGRMREIAVRASLGGSRARIVRQLLTESLLLAGVGGALGIVLAQGLVQGATALLPEDALPAGIELTVDFRIVLFAVAATLATGILFGLAPAWQAGRLSLTDALRSGGRALTGSAARFRTALAIAEIAVAMMLVVGAGLLLRTLLTLDNVDPGFRANNVLTMSLGLPSERYTQERALTFYESVEREVHALPGVGSVGFATNMPVAGWDIGQGFDVIGKPPVGEAQRPAAHYQMVSPDYFRTLGIQLLRGRPIRAR